MQVSKWMIAAPLFVAMSASAQTAQPAPASQPGKMSVTLATQTSSSQGTPAQGGSQQPTAAPSTLEQVVDRIILRDDGLIDMLKTHTPIVETYLQNLEWDAQLGPVPKDDRYFLGRIDLTES